MRRNLSSGRSIRKPFKKNMRRKMRILKWADSGRKRMKGGFTGILGTLAGVVGPIIAQRLAKRAGKKIISNIRKRRQARIKNRKRR